jgi:hypothetical protein
MLAKASAPVDRAEQALRFSLYPDDRSAFRARLVSEA